MLFPDQILKSIFNAQNILTALAVGAIVFFILREFWCWYFKLNRIEELLEKIEKNTRPAIQTSKEPNPVASVDEKYKKEVIVEPKPKVHVLTEEERLFLSLKHKAAVQGIYKGIKIAVLLIIIAGTAAYIFNLLT